MNFKLLRAYVYQNRVSLRTQPNCLDWLICLSQDREPNEISAARTPFNHKAVFKSCMTGALKTLRITHDPTSLRLIAQQDLQINFNCSDRPVAEDTTHVHSYFEYSRHSNKIVPLPRKII